MIKTDFSCSSHTKCEQVYTNLHACQLPAPFVTRTLTHPSREKKRNGFVIFLILFYLLLIARLKNKMGGEERRRDATSLGFYLQVTLDGLSSVFRTSSAWFRGLCSSTTWLLPSAYLHRLHLLQTRGSLLLRTASAPFSPLPLPK